MSYAVRNDGQGWRAVSGVEDISADEWYTPQTPPDPVALPLSADELDRLAREARDRLLAVAANKMGPLQDAVEEGEDVPDEVALLKLWKQYRIALNRIDKQDGFPQVIDWPVPPDETPNL
ncbi:tail fiber assembly protein [Pseudomonas sp. MF4836]|uniref:tail fiber assembly protein n=1 Tax=Pseudomonas sp. MF4836 TaxID=1960827 RepID=UPI000996B4C7|nr:tail fiber assembly protein [Pseudomonas sp. MF4836]